MNKMKILLKYGFLNINASEIFVFLTLITACIVFAIMWPQPVIYDALSYKNLSEQKFEWIYVFPYIENQSIRSYAYPLIIKIFMGKYGTLAFQFIIFAFLSCVINRLFSFNKLSNAIVITAMFIAVPILVVYSGALLTDLSGSVFLQSSFLLIARSTGKQQCSRLFLAGLLMGLCFQVRPSYALLFWPILIAILMFRYYRLKASITKAFHARIIASLILLAVFFTGWIIPGIPTLTSNIIKTKSISFMPPSDKLIASHMLMGNYLDYWSSNPVPFEKHKVALQKLSNDGIDHNLVSISKALK